MLHAGTPLRFLLSSEPTFVKELLSEEELGRGVARLARNISEYYHNRPLTIVGVLTGSLVLLADLIRHLYRNLPYVAALDDEDLRKVSLA